MLQDAAPSDQSPLGNRDFAAVLLTGGRSSRMGRDKSGIVLAGRPLWERQLAVLRALQPRELFISGHPDGPYNAAGVEIVQDMQPGCGPLSGLQAALRRTTAEWVVILAIDLPAMEANFLAGLLDQAWAHQAGVVPIIDDWFEPLAAVYPRSCLALVEERLNSDDYAMQAFLREAHTRNLIEPRPVAPVEVGLFRNVNTPGDLNHDFPS